MRISPTKLLHGLLYTAPVLLLTLAACGGGGGGPPAVTPTTYTVGGTVSGLDAGDTFILRNNSNNSESKTITANGSYTFSTAITVGGNYEVTVLTHPLTAPAKKCTITGTVSRSNWSANVTDADVTCALAYTIGGSFSGTAHGAGLVLQNNGGDDLLIPAGAASTTFTFSTPLAGTDNYLVTIPSQPLNQTCTVTPSGLTPVGNNPVPNVDINCGVPSAGTADPNVFTADYGDNTVSDTLFATRTSELTGSKPYAIAIDPINYDYLYAVNSEGNTISLYTNTTGVLAVHPQTDIATGSGPRAITIHPSGKFLYVANFISNSVSAYSVDSSFGVLARIDTDGVATDIQLSIPAKVGPSSIAIDPEGKYAYVANAGVSSSTDGSVSVYSINATGALTPIDADGAGAGTTTFLLTGGKTSTSVAIDPDGTYLLVTNQTSQSISAFAINAADGSLSPPAITTGVTTPTFISIYPGGGFAYVSSDKGLSSAGDILTYPITAGALGIPSAPIPVGVGPLSISTDSTGVKTYVANSGASTVTAFTNTAGVLTAPVTLTTGTNPYSVITSP